jgi:glycosyltransferase involved in cell wall biosynthesis
MKVMMIEPLGDGGITHYTYNLLHALSANENELFLYTSKEYEFKDNDVKFQVYNKMFRLAYMLIKLFPWLSKEYTIPNTIRRFVKLLEYPFNVMESVVLIYLKRIPLVHFQTVNLIELAMILAYKIFNIKVVFTIHNVKPRHQDFKFYHPFLYKLMYRLCDHIIIHSKQGMFDVMRLFSVKQEKISVIPHGDYKFFTQNGKMSKKTAKIKLGLSDQDRTILFFGAIRKNKGLDQIILALPSIIDRLRSAKLLIVGEPCEDYSKYKNMIVKNNLSQFVYEKLDYIENNQVYQYFLAADLVVLPYHEITQSGVLQIAYAFSKPVVASAIGGFLESIIEGKNGYLVPPGDTASLASKVSDVLEDRDKIKRMGDYSRYLSDSQYSWDSIAEKTFSVYSHLS